jgi:hypothetical protein
VFFDAVSTRSKGSMGDGESSRIFRPWPILYPSLISIRCRDRKCPQMIAGKQNQGIIPRIEGGARSRTSSLFVPPAVRFLPVPGLEKRLIYVESVLPSTRHVVSTTSHKTDTSFFTQKIKAWFPSSDVPYLQTKNRSPWISFE